jgi:hypothetical protein
VYNAGETVIFVCVLMPMKLFSVRIMCNASFVAGQLALGEKSSLFDSLASRKLLHEIAALISPDFNGTGTDVWH